MTTLRDYQQAANDAIAARFFDAGKNRLLIAIATAGGKTVTFAALPSHPRVQPWLAQFPSTRRLMLVVAHREELLNQAAQKICRENPDLRVDIEQADRHATPMADVVVASIQTLAARDGRRLERFNADAFRIVIIDEAHHAAADSYRSALQYLKFLPPDPLHEDATDENGTVLPEPDTLAMLAEWDEIAPKDRLLVGFTATPDRGDGVGLECVFQEIAYSKGIRELIEAGYLAPLRGVSVHTKTSLDGVHTQRGDFVVGELSNAVNTPERNALAVAAWKQHATGRKTIAFTVDVQHAHDLAVMFAGDGIPAVPLSAKTPTDERAAVIQRLGDPADALMVCPNVGIMSEGTDIPLVSCILHTRPTKSGLLYRQMSGRSGRLHPLKTDALLIDLVDLATRHSLHTASTLFGFPSSLDPQGKNLTEIAGEIEALQAQYPGLDIVNAVSIADLRMRAQQIDLWAVPDLGVAKQWTSLNWIRDGEHYRLSYPVGFGTVATTNVYERLSVERNMLGHWDAVLTTDYGRTGVAYGKPSRQQQTVLRDQLSAEQALRTAEAWIGSHRRDVFRLKARNAGWRGQPASEAQLKALQRMRLPIRPGITKGAASDLLDLKRGRGTR